MIVKGTVHCNLHNHYPYIINYVATVRDGQVIEYTDEVVQYGMNHMKEARDESAYMDMVTKAIDEDVARQLDNGIEEGYVRVRYMDTNREAR